MVPRPIARNAALIALLLLPFLVLYRPLLLGEAFLPADLLRPLYPWKAVSPADPTTPWNVLRFDGITEFYPWRHTASEAFHAGKVPLWNPYSFGADGGTPLLANSQSAPLYPLNVFFWLMPPGLFMYAFGLTVALHLLLLAKGMYHFLRVLGLGRSACLLGAITVTLSAPVITWLALPTFLCVATWIPWTLLLVHRAHERMGIRAGFLATVGVGGTSGLMLLAGHLQMAFYGLLAVTLYALTLGIRGLRAASPAARIRPVPWLAGFAAALALALGLSAPQVLPALELSRVSHRATGPPTLETYDAYISNALPPQSLVTLIAPDFFGHPNADNGLYLNVSSKGRPNNYAEWAAYVGVTPLILALFALCLPWKGSPLPRERAFFAGLGLLTLLLAFGTPLNLPFFFLVPGYSQTGNPARCLILFAVAIAGLAAIGLHGALSDAISLEAKKRATLVAAVACTVIAALGLNFAAAMTAKFLNVPFAEILARGSLGLLLGGVWFLLTVCLLAALPRLKASQLPVGVLLLVLLTAADLLLWGYGYNPSAPAKDVYPETPGIAWLKEHASDALIAPINRQWSMSGEAPRNAVLPPNGLAAYGLHDIAGYDSLFLAKSKEAVRAATGEDPSPPENGNMVFVKSVEAAKALDAKYIVAPPDAPDLTNAGLTRVYPGSDATAGPADMVIYENAGGKTFDPSPGAAYQPTTFRLGLYLMVCALAAVTACALARPRVPR